MLLRDKDTVVFKKWLLPKLEIISDADAEVLADYVIALITANEDEGAVRRGCLESLVDFLGDNTAPFVDEVIGTLKDGSWVANKEGKGVNGVKTEKADTPTPTKPAQPQSSSHRQQQTQASKAGPIPSIVGNATNADYEPLHSRASNTPPVNAPTGPAASRATNTQNHPKRPQNGPPTSQSNAPGIKVKGQGTKKRKQVHQDASETPGGQDAHYNRTNTGNRPTKQATRRGLKGGVGANNLRAGAVSFEPQITAPPFVHIPPLMPNMANPSNMANLPPPPAGPMPFDANNPMAFFTMMAALGMNMPLMPSPSNVMHGKPKVGKCYSYHEKGFCNLGSMCSFQHGETENTPEYDPNQPSISMPKDLSASRRPGMNRNHAKGGRPRADFSLPGPTTDRTNTTLVVEQIPQEHFSEDDVRGYFSEFGTIVDVEMHSYKRLAVIQYEDHSAASRAYNSPKAVFENRFVKVYWKRPDTVLGAPNTSGDTDMKDAYEDDEDIMSREEIEKRTAEAQRAFEERRRKAEEADARAVEIDRLLKEKDAEMRKIRKQLAKLAGEEVNETNTNAIKDFSHDLATLQAEAENLFGTAATPAFADRGGPVRGVYQGPFFSSYSTRGRGFAPLRGRGAPRGAFSGRGRVAVSVKRLDNRPRRLAVSKIEKGTPKDEALRQYLLGLPECTNIELHPEKPDTVILTFQERYQAESFLDSSRHIPDTGPLDLSWIPNDAFGGLTPSTTTTTTTTRNIPADSAEVGIDSDDDDSSATAAGAEVEIKVEAQEDADMDVAEDTDQWL